MADIANLGVRFDTSELKEGKAALEAIAPAAAKAETATEKLATASDNVAVAAAKGGTALKNEATAAAAGTTALNNTAAAATRLTAANNNAAASAQKVTAATNGLTGQVGNLSAQFGDIAVQLAGGQSPFQIALQQGLQLIGIFGNAGLGSVIRGLGSAFLALVSPLSLITIGVITLGGYVVQWLTDWISKGSEANLKIEEQQALIRGLGEAWGTGIPAIDAYIAKIDEAKMKADALAGVKILTSEAIAADVDTINQLNVELAAIRSDLILFGDTGVTASENIRVAFVSLIEKVSEGKATQEDFNAVISAANGASAIGVSGVDSFISALGRLAASALTTTGIVQNLNAAVSAAQNKALNDPKTWRGAGNMGSGDGPIQNSSDPNLPMTGPVPGSRGTPELSGFPWESFTGGGGGRGGKAAKGGGGGAAKVQTDLQKITEGLQKLNEPFNQAKSAYTALETAMKNGTIGNDEYQQSLEKIRTAFIAAGGDADQWATVTASSTKKVSDATSAAKDITKGFFSDLISGIRNGETAWESFGKAAMNVLDKVIDKLLNEFLDAIFETNKASPGGGGGGLLSGIGGFITSLFKSAKGNAFDGGSRPMAFATGGAFSNSVVNRPTAFSMGLMGEAGPEAIMPLSRGPDGSLGVQMHAANANSRSGPSNDVRVTNQYTLSGAISEETVIARIEASAEKTREQVRKTLVGDLNQYQRDGTL